MRNLYKIYLFLFIYLNNLYALDKEQKLSYINTKNITYNEFNNTIELGKNSLININDSNISLNKGIIDYNQDKIQIFGNLYIYQDINIISAVGLVGNTTLTNFKTNKVSYIYNDELKMDSETLERKNNEIYFYDNFLSPCKLDGYFNCPTWSLKMNKSKYIIDKDKFIHYDTFLQIVDKKVLYLPYFSHYGQKAPRQKGFLSPSLNINLLNGGSEINLPYYLPINISDDLLLTPTIEVSSNNFEIFNNFKINSVLNTKRSGGTASLDLTTIINENEKNFYNSATVYTKQTINKYNQLEFNTLITNSISKTRSTNEDQINYVNSYIKLNTYDVYKENDILNTEINTVTSFDDSNNDYIPIQSPYIKYTNFYDITPNTYLSNDLSFFVLERNNSYLDNPKKNIGINFTNEVNQNNLISNSLLNNKFILNYNYRKLDFDDNANNAELYKTNLILSSSIATSIYKDLLNGKFKIIINDDLSAKENNLNEDSNSITFNYNHLFNENRFFGHDLSDNTKRLVYGMEFEKNVDNNKYFFNIGQSYDLITSNSYLNKINQNSNLSDLALETGIESGSYRFKLDSRNEHSTLSKKEMNYSFGFEKKTFNLNLDYNETSNKAFLGNSDNSKSLKTDLKFNLNENIILGYSTNIDLKNNYSPFESELNINLFDECSQLEIKYKNTKYSDNFITTPEEIISLTYKMDYLGFFGYEQETNLFFSEGGNYFYGKYN